jgi:4-amino-4-deoxy-L-arabinose transferase-like glycosyltransferase
VRTAEDRPIKLALAIGIIAIAVRFVGINQPFTDRWSWRQSDVAAIARNYFQNGFHFAYPQIDWAGDQPGYVGTEFPFLPFIAAICYKFLGVHEWIGRSQAVILFAASLPFFFLLVRDTWHGPPAHVSSAGCRCHFGGSTAATWALFFYSFAPLNLMASRCFMPDVPSLSLAIIGLYFFLRWTDNDETKLLLASAVLISLSILIKLPSILIGAPLAYLAFQSFGIRAFRRWGLWIFAAIALVPSAIWYWHAHEIAEKFYPHHFFGAGGIQFMNAGWYWNILEETFGSSLTPLLGGLAVFFIFTERSPRRARLFHVWLAAMILFVVVAGYGNRHPWYRLPLVPIAAAYAGATCSWMGVRWLRNFNFNTAAGIIVVMFGILSYIFTGRYYHESAADLRALGLELNRTTPERSLIVAADYGDPTVFYYAERKGWHFLETEGIYNGHPTSSFDAVADLEELRNRGATHFVIYSATFWWLDYYKEFAQHLSTTATLVEARPEFRIYKLNAAQ